MRMIFSTEDADACREDIYDVGAPISPRITNDMIGECAANHFSGWMLTCSDTGDFN